MTILLSRGPTCASGVTTARPYTTSDPAGKITAMSVVAGQISVGTSATPLNVADPSGCFLSTHNKGTGSVFLGDEGVTTTSGFELATSDSVLTFTVGSDEIIYAVASTTQRVDVLQTYAGG
jgi:hypothetical protein